MVAVSAGEAAITIPAGAAVSDCEWEHGGFVYFYEQPRHDCFFRVIAAPAEQNSVALQCAIVPYSLVQDETSGVCEADELLCKVCLDEKLAVLLLPCAHFCVCKKCATELPSGLCPMCRSTVETRIDVFL